MVPLFLALMIHLQLLISHKIYMCAYLVEVQKCIVSAEL